MRLFATLLAGAVAMTPGATRADPDGRNRMVWIYNRTNQPIYFLYGSCSDGCETWEEDLLGTNVLMPNRRLSVNMNDDSGECDFDFKAVLKGGREMKKWRIDVCAATSITFGGRSV